MGERVVKVRLSAQVAEYQRGMFESARATRTVGTEAEKLAQTKQAFESVGRGAVVMGGLIGAGVTVAVAKFVEFDAAMSDVNAATGETAENMALLREAALDAGASTVYSATEAANAVEELAKAGVSTADVLSGALAGSLDLAAAGQLGVARAAEITSTALNQYSLDGGQAAHVADVLAAGAGKAMGSVDDLANGLKFVGPVAASMGVSLEETTGVLALFAQQGIIGEQAGTSLRGVLSSLTSPSAQARGEIDRLGLTLYDAQGNFLGLENAAGQLSNAYGSMDGASRDASLGIIFGRETVTAATALYKAGARGVEEWTAAVDDSGYAAEQARMRLDNLKGDVEALQGAMDSALIETGSAANDILRAIVQSSTGLVDVYNDLPEPVQTATLLIGAAAAAVALSGGAALIAVPKWAELRAAVSSTGLSMGKIALQGAGVGAALTVATAALGAVVAKQAEMRAGAQEFADTLDEATGATTRYTREMVAKKLADSGAFDGARKAGVSQKELTDAVFEGGAAYDDLRQKMRKAHEESLTSVPVWESAAIGNSINAMSDLNVQLGDARQRHMDMKAAQEESAGAVEAGSEKSKVAAEAYIEAAGGASKLQDTLSELIDMVNKANGVGQDAITANIAYNDALAQVDETIQKARDGAEGYGITLDQNTQVGRDNMGMLVDLAQRAEDAARKQFDLDGNTLAYKQTLEDTRQALIDRATELYGNAEQAGALADQILRIPSDTQWKVIAETNRARSELDGFISTYNGRQIRLDVATDSLDPTSIRPSAQGNLFDYSAFANGGGVQTGIYAGRPAAIHKFAEPETVWEAFISGKPDQRERNVGIWQETGRRLGVGADGGGTQVTVNQEIKALPGMDERAIGDRAAERANFALR